MRHAYGAMVAINLPWLSGRHRDEEREAEETLQAERHALESTQNTVRYELRDAAARVDSARQSFTHHRPGPARAGEAEPRGDAGGVRRRPGRRGRPARRASVVPAGADRARARAGGAGVERGGSRTRRRDAGRARRQAMSAARRHADDRASGRPPAGAEGPPRGVATMSIVRWVLVAIAALVAVGSIVSYAGVHLGGGEERVVVRRSSTPARCTRRSCRTTRASVRSAA